MTIQVLIAHPLRKLTDGLGRVEAEGRTLREIIDALEARFPGIKASILNRNGKVLPHLNIFLNDLEIHTLEGLETPVQQGDQVAIIPAIAGGC